MDFQDKYCTDRNFCQMLTSIATEMKSIITLDLGITLSYNFV